MKKDQMVEIISDESYDMNGLLVAKERQEAVTFRTTDGKSITAIVEAFTPIFGRHGDVEIIITTLTEGVKYKGRYNYRTCRGVLS